MPRSTCGILTLRRISFFSIQLTGERLDGSELKRDDGSVERTGFVETIEPRVRSVGAMILAEAAAGDRHVQRKIEEGHVDGDDADASFLRQHRDDLQSALTPMSSA